MKVGRGVAAAAALGLFAGTGAGPSAGPIRRAEGDLTMAYHRRYPLEPGGRVSLNSVTGTVRVTAWDHDVVEVHAIKSACTSRRLHQARVEIEAEPGSVRIRTLHDDPDATWTDDERSKCDNPAIVDYVLLVPRAARLEGISLVNGDLQIEGAAGPVRAWTVGGRLAARGLSGGASLSTIDGRLEVSVEEGNAGRPLTLASVSGSIHLFLPRDADAHLTARTGSGAIRNDFGLPVRRAGYAGRSVEGVLGEGGPSIEVSSVNGSIAIHMSLGI